jgi:hypothetical protein
VKQKYGLTYSCSFVDGGAETLSKLKVRGGRVGSSLHPYHIINTMSFADFASSSSSSEEEEDKEEEEKRPPPIVKRNKSAAEWRNFYPSWPLT